MPSESPTRIESTPARSRARAVGKSYAVSIVIGSPRSFFAWSVRSVIFRWGEGDVVDMAIFSVEVRRPSKRSRAVDASGSHDAIPAQAGS